MAILRTAGLILGWALTYSKRKSHMVLEIRLLAFDLVRELEEEEEEEEEAVVILGFCWDFNTGKIGVG
ncbi:hypothetical protein HS088_TW03G01089 [Tripterygium wilfordii]|uniref:Uncharacterized protein n=1 Tax=Tripterygium wilfordii TaxID=458696 RepID=A0A7J7DWJ5_TRIWF|nr:hypothetical protein HS088_TW03G01089 [Tripterygium wilfordii]